MQVGARRLLNSVCRRSALLFSSLRAERSNPESLPPSMLSTAPIETSERSRSQRRGLSARDLDGGRSHHRRRLTKIGLGRRLFAWCRQNSGAQASRERHFIARICAEAPIMPAWRDKPANDRNFTKRRSALENRALIDAAYRATHRLYCDALRLWLACPSRPCLRHRRCVGEATACLNRALPAIAPAQLAAARQQVIAGGPHRVPPATHIEWVDSAQRRGVGAGVAVLRMAAPPQGLATEFRAPRHTVFPGRSAARSGALQNRDRHSDSAPMKVPDRAASRRVRETDNVKTKNTVAPSAALRPARR